MEFCVNNIMLVDTRDGLFERVQAAFGNLVGVLMSVLTVDAQSTSRSVMIDELAEVRRSIEGESDAYKKIIERHQNHISKIMWRFSRDKRTHEDLVQEVFVEAYLALKTYKAKAPLENWLARIATRVGYGFWRKQERLKKIETFALEDWDRLEQSSDQGFGGSDPEDAAELLYKLLAKLAPRDRLVLTLRFIEQCSIEETASRTGWSVSLVKVQTFRAKDKLRKLFHDAGKEMEL